MFSEKTKTKSYNLFSPFKKILSQKKHLKEQEKEIFNCYFKDWISFAATVFVRIFAVFLIILCCHVVCASSKKYLEKYVPSKFVVLQDANLRDAPSLDSNIVRVIYKNEKIKGKIDGKWLETKYKKQICYISVSVIEQYDSGWFVLVKVIANVLGFFEGVVKVVFIGFIELFKAYAWFRALWDAFLLFL